MRPDPLGARLPEPSGVLKGRGAPVRRLLWLAAMMIVLVAILSLQSIARDFTADQDLILAMAFVTVAVAYGAYVGLVRWGERRPANELTLAPLPKELCLGIAIGGAIMSLTIVPLALTGVYTISPGHWTDLPHDIREALGTGLLEELLARLVLFRLLCSAFGVRPALAVSAVLFGAAHAFNPGASLSSTLAIAVEAGLTFAGFYLLTGRIWLSVGAHAGWNFVQGGVFGARVSGMPSKGSLFVTTPKAGAPSWLSGGAFGPEASLLAVVIGFGVFLFCLRLLQRASRSADPCVNRHG